MLPPSCCHIAALQHWCRHHCHCAAAAAPMLPCYCSLPSALLHCQSRSHIPYYPLVLMSSPSYCHAAALQHWSRHHRRFAAAASPMLTCYCRHTTTTAMLLPPPRCPVRRRVTNKLPPPPLPPSRHCHHHHRRRHYQAAAATTKLPPLPLSTLRDKFENEE